MRNRSGRFLLGTTLILLCILPRTVHPANAPSPGGGVGDLVPDFSAATLDGKLFRLSGELADGRIVLLNFWGLRCGACIEEIPHLNAIAERHGGKISVAGVNVDGAGADTLRQQMERIRLSIGYAVLPDPEMRLVDMFRLAGAPLNVIIGRDGRVNYRHEGFEEGDDKALEKAIADALRIQGN